jgi:sugar O-acyltransferase (sialic acid O-acetyltransferase NeuD family)
VLRDGRPGAYGGAVASGLIFVAASGLALEVAEAARASGRAVLGCVDDDATRWGQLAGGWLSVLGGLDLVAAHPDAPLVVCAGRGQVRAGLVDRLVEMGAGDRFTSVLHPSVDVPPSCTVGVGSILLAGVTLTANVVVGDHVVCMPSVTLTHDDEVRDFATLCATVTLGGGVVVGRGAYLGMSSSVRERVEIGDDSILGMGACLLEDLPSGQTWVGVPARDTQVRQK